MFGRIGMLSCIRRMKTLNTAPRSELPKALQMALATAFTSGVVVVVAFADGVVSNLGIGIYSALNY